MSNIRVLIVEDDPLISYLHKAILQKNGIVQDPLTFMNGEEAWKFLLNDDANNFYLILLDLNMPVLNGWEFLERLEDNEHIACRTKIAIVTSSINPADKKKAEQYASVEYYLPKPLRQFAEINKLLEMLNNLSGVE